MSVVSMHISARYVYYLKKESIHNLSVFNEIQWGRATPYMLSFSMQQSISLSYKVVYTVKNPSFGTINHGQTLHALIRLLQREQSDS